jgi:hypothetical protein
MIHSPILEIEEECKPAARDKDHGERLADTFDHVATEKSVCPIYFGWTSLH